MGAAKIPSDKVTTQIDKFIRMEAHNCTRAEKLKEIFGIDIATESPRKVNNADATMCRWRKHPLYDQIWKDEIGKQDYKIISEATNVMLKSMRQDKDGWLAMQSALNLLNGSLKRVYRDEEKNISVQITGLPDIGSPDNDG